MTNSRGEDIIVGVEGALPGLAAALLGQVPAEEEKRRKYLLQPLSLALPLRHTVESH